MSAALGWQRRLWRTESTIRGLRAASIVLASPLARYVTGAQLAVHGGGERPAYLDAAKK